MKFNINDYVFVKLTPEGIKILADKHAKLKEQFPNLYDFKMPEIDRDGYTKYQMWELFDRFGDCVGLGCRLPFETDIEIPIKSEGEN